LVGDRGEFDSRGAGCRLRGEMICPQCQAEYREGFTRCADCDLELVRAGAGTIVAPAGEHARPGESEEDPFCSFWKGEDARLHAELCQVLDDAGIPHKSVYQRDHLFNLRNYSAFQVGVPFSLFEKAENAVKQAFCPDEYEAMGLLENGGSREKQADEEQDGDPEDATVKVWEGNQGALLQFITAALAENQIFSRAQKISDGAELYVMEMDEIRAREIVREVAEAEPPS
jgi:hypothetical protein